MLILWAKLPLGGGDVPCQHPPHLVVVGKSVQARNQVGVEVIGNHVGVANNILEALDEFEVSNYQVAVSKDIILQNVDEGKAPILNCLD